MKALYFWFLTMLGGYCDWSLSRKIHYCMRHLRQKEAYLKDQKVLFVNCLSRGILIFFAAPGVSAALLQNEKCGKEVRNVPDS